MTENAREKVINLTCWSGSVDPVPLDGGITNTNFVVTDQGKKFVVRIGADIPVHGVMRFNEHSASRAGHAAGLSPAVIHTESDVMVMDFIESRTLSAEDVRAPGVLERIIPMLKTVHYEMPNYLEGPALVFWVFQVMRDYRRTLRKDGYRLKDDLVRLEKIADDLERAVGPVTLVFGHNDLLPANFLDDGNRLWLLDWDYAGFNSPLFDLSNLASNNDFDETRERQMLELYFGVSVDARADADLWKSYSAMKCASLLREAMWSMISEKYSVVDFDFVSHTAENLEYFEKGFEHYKSMESSI